MFLGLIVIIDVWLSLFGFQTKYDAFIKCCLKFDDEVL